MARLDGDLDARRFRRHAEDLLASHGEIERPDGTARLGPVEIAVRQEEGGHKLVIEAPAERLDGVGLVRTFLELAQRSTHATASPRTATGETAAVAGYFRDLLEEETAAGGMRFWPADPALCATAGLAEALGREARGNGEGVVAAVDPEVAERAAELAGESGASLEALLLAGWRLLLRRLAPGEEGFLGVYRPGPAAELAETMGFLGRYVPVAVAVGAESLREATDATGKFLREAEQWVDFFRWPEPGGGRFFAGFRHLDLPPLIKVESAVAEVQEVEAPIEQLDLELRVTGAAVSPRIEVWVGPSLDPRLAQLLADSIGDLLRLSPDRPVPRLLGRPARARGESASPNDGEEDVLSLVLAAADRAPAAVAARHGAVGLSYAQLMAGAAGVAAALRERGVESGDRVALCMPRRPELLAAILGIWWQGASVVLIDPEHPPGRHARILDDVDPKLLLCPAGEEPGTRERGIPTMSLSAVPPAPDTAIDRAPLSGSQLAYVMYTSGSTGRPKGVEVTHAALANYVRWASQRYCRPDGHGSLAHSSIAADLTLSSLLVPLVAGKTVWMLEESDPESLGRLLGQVERLDFLKLTPGGLTLLREMLSAENLAAATGHLVLGGEALGRAAIEFLADSAPDLLITNEYGPTETTIGSSAYTFRAGDPTRDPVPIGKPIWNTEVEILLAGGDPAPAGVIGEIAIYGAGVASGYRRMPAETEARFLRDAEGRRGYRTGDMGRIWPGDDLEYQGRRDRQVKIHGYRVETAEVEAVLNGQPGVRTAAVVAVPGAEREVFLSAFAVFENGQGDEALAEVETALRGELPWYACPDRFEGIAELPLTSAGKLDRDALVIRSKRENGQSASPVPSSERMRVLAEIWQRLLDCPAPLPGDSFFALGGSSLQALHLVAECRRAGLSLTIRDVVQQRTLARIAAAAAPVEPVGRTTEVGAVPNLPLSPSQLSFLALGFERARNWALRWVGPVAGSPDRDRIEAALSAVRRRHPALRCSISLDPPWRASIAAEPAGPAAEFIDIPGLPADRLESWIDERLREMETGLDPENGVMSRLAVFDCGSAAGTSQLGWVVHHLACDLVSLQTLERDLWLAYETGGLEPPDDGYLDWLRTVSAALPPVQSPVPVATGEVREKRESLPLRARLADRAAREGKLLRVVALALSHALAEARAESPVRFFVETHGRGGGLAEAPAEAVGWLTAFKAVEVDPGQLDSRAETLAAVDRGLSGPLVRSLDPAAAALNFLGDLGQFSAGAAARLFRGDDPFQPLLFGLELVCWVEQGELGVVWRYDEGRWGRAEVDRLARAFAGEIAEAGNGAGGAEAPEVSDPSLGAEDLDRIRRAFQ